MANNVTAKKLGTRQIVIVGMLSAISVILGLSGYGFIPLPIAKATILHLPVIIGAILEGPIVGAFIGLIFGLFSMYQNILAPSVLQFAFLNPLVAIVPRVLIGITSYYAYRFMLGKSETLKVGVGAAIGSLTNTFGVLTMIFVLYAQKYAEVRNIDPKGVAWAIYSIAATNGIAEAFVAVIITVPLVIAVKKIRK